MGIHISEKTTGRFIIEISEGDLDVLIGHMEEESSKDKDYFVEHTAIDALERLGASGEFVSALRAEVGTSEGIDIVWSRKG